MAQGESDRTEGGSKLPRGPHRLPREVVVDHQRQRLFAATARALAEHGYAELTVEQILKEAGVSRTTFYEHFNNKRECVLVSHEVAFGRLSAGLRQACGGKDGWPAKVAAGVSAAVDYARAVPDEARLLVLDAVGTEPVLARRAVASTEELTDFLRSGRDQSERAAELPELTERALVGAMTSVIGARLVAGRADSLPALKPQLVELMLMPYVGLEEARRLASSGA